MCIRDRDAIMDRLYDLDNRKVKFIECYDNLGSGKPNGCLLYTSRCV